MIKLFRNIRKKLLQEGSPAERAGKTTNPAFAKASAGTYLKYAIGEIILVVVGILIALQINNWNEGRKDLDKSYEILREIKENIQFNTMQFDAQIKEEQSVINSIDIVFENINSVQKYNDSLGFHIFNTGYWPASSMKSSGYESLKSQGVELIKTIALRQAIIDLYEKTYNEISEVTRISENNSQSTLVPLFTELFLMHPSIPNQPFKELGATPFDYEKLIQSQKYKGVLRFWRHSRTVAIELRMTAIQKNNELIDAIDNELKEKNDR